MHAFLQLCYGPFQLANEKRLIYERFKLAFNEHFDDALLELPGCEGDCSCHAMIPVETEAAIRQTERQLSPLLLC